MRSYAVLWVDVVDVTQALSSAVRRAWAEAMTRRAAAAELRALDAAGLADLGISREQIEDYVAGRFHPADRHPPRLRVIAGGASAAAA